MNSECSEEGSEGYRSNLKNVKIEDLIEELQEKG